MRRRFSKNNFREGFKLRHHQGEGRRDTEISNVRPKKGLGVCVLIKIYKIMMMENLPLVWC